MVAAQLQSEKFAEDLYFLLMSSPMQNRVMSLAHKHGLTRQKLRKEVLALADELTERIEISVQDTVHEPAKKTN